MSDREGVTTTQGAVGAAAGPCCQRQGPHVHYVPRKPEVNAAGDVDRFDASNQPTMNLDTGEVTPGVIVDATEVEEIVTETEEDDAEQVDE